MIDMAYGPLSPEIVEAVYRCSARTYKTMMLIASRNQIDYDHGYVMDTYQFGNLIAEMEDEYPSADIVICRDHCGYGFRPSYGTQILDYEGIKTTIWKDIENGFKLIHIDLCKREGSYEEQLEETCRLIDFCKEEEKDIMIEVGTDECTGKCETDLAKVEKELDMFMQHIKPTYYVVNTGSKVVENYNLEQFEEENVRAISELVKSRDIQIKEHNADYLDKISIRKRVGLVGAMNIAPQLGVVQTCTVLNECNIRGIRTDKFEELVVSRNNWRKWSTSDKRDRKKCLMLGGHYHFNSEEYKRIVDRLPDMKEMIIRNISRIIEHYEETIDEESPCRVCV